MTISFDSFFFSFVDLSLFDVIKRVFLGKGFDSLCLKDFKEIIIKKLLVKTSVFHHVMSYLRFKIRKSYISSLKKKKNEGIWRI